MSACRPNPHPHRTGTLPKRFDGPEAKVDLLFRRLDGNLETMSRRERFVWIIDWYRIELDNGGTDQVFYNSSGGTAAQAIEAFEAIGSTESAATLRRICDLFPEGDSPGDYVLRRQQMAAIRGKDPDAFRRFDGQWLNDDVFQRLIDYWKANEPTEPASDSDRRRSEVTTLFLELPLEKGEDYPRLTDRQRYLWEVCWLCTLGEGDGLLDGRVVDRFVQDYSTLLVGLEAIGALKTAALFRSIGDGPGKSLSDDLRFASNARQALRGIQMQNGVVTGTDWQEDLYDILLNYWKRQE